MTVQSIKPELDLADAEKAAPLGFVVRLLPGLVKVIDSLCILLAGFVTYYSVGVYSYKTVDIYNAAIVFNWLLTIGLLHIGGLYSLDALLRPGRNHGAIILAVVTSFALMLAAAFSMQISDMFSRLWVTAFLASEALSLVLARQLISYALTQMEGRKLLARKVVLFGDEAYVKNMRSHLESSQTHFLNFSRSFQKKLLDDAMKVDRAELERMVDELIVHLRTRTIDDVVIALPWHASKDVRQVVNRLRELPVNVYLGADAVGLDMNLSPPKDSLRDAAVFEVVGRPLSGWDAVLKAVEDYVLALILFVVLLPVFLVVALAIKLDGPGPVLFRQKRYGFNNEEFEIFKFRTMRVDQPKNDKIVQAVPGDSRVTRVGRFLRKTSIDELPQLLNVLGGSMSIVGPRPHVGDQNEDYAKQIRGYFARHRVKPGVTGLAQVMGCRGMTDTLDKMESRVRYDIQYTENWSLALDLKILAKTFVVCLKGENAY